MERVGLLSLALHKIEEKKKSRIRRASWAAAWGEGPTFTKKVNDVHSELHFFYSLTELHIWDKRC